MVAERRQFLGQLDSTTPTVIEIIFVVWTKGNTPPPEVAHQSANTPWGLTKRDRTIRPRTIRPRAIRDSPKLAT